MEEAQAESESSMKRRSCTMGYSTLIRGIGRL